MAAAVILVELLNQAAGVGSSSGWSNSTSKEGQRDKRGQLAVLAEKKG